MTAAAFNNNDLVLILKYQSHQGEDNTLLNSSYFTTTQKAASVNAARDSRYDFYWADISSVSSIIMM